MNRWHALFVAASLLIAAAVPPAIAATIGQWSGQYAGTTEPLVVVATTAEQWTKMTNLAGNSSKPFLPFDAAKQTGIGIFLGRRNTGGHTVQIVSMGPNGGKFVVVVDEMNPGPDTITTQALASPWLILLIDRPDLPVSVEPRFHAN